MEFYKLPQNLAPLSGPLVYAFATSSARDFDVKIFDANTDETVGAKRFLNTADGSMDAAPALRRRLNFQPKPGPTGFISAIGRTVPASVGADGIRSPTLTFVPAAQPIVPPMLLSTLPWSRQIGRGECDELTLYTTAPCVIRAEAGKDGTLTKTRTFTASEAGFALFRLDTADFPDADVLQLFIGGLGTIIYYFTDFGAGHRLAWRSSAGAIEHYTFPIEKDAEEQSEKQTVLTDDGPRNVSVRSRRFTTLLSAYEPQQTLVPLAGILSSPAVWSVENGAYIPVEVIGNASGLRRRGTLCNLEVRIGYPVENLLP